MQFFAIVLVSPETNDIAQEEIDFLADCFDLDPSNLEVMLAEVRDASGFECWIEDGALYQMTTHNPQGHWDSYLIWTVQDNVWPMPDTPEDFTPIAVINPVGAWHDLGYKFIRNDDERSASFAQSRREAQEFLAQYPAS